MTTSSSKISWTENAVRRLAGVMILASLGLGVFVHPGWFGLTIFVGLNLLQSSFTGFCPAEKLLKRIDPTCKAETATTPN
jgi:hypothetical protein